MTTGITYNSSVHYIHSYATWDRHDQASILSFQGDISHSLKAPTYDLRNVAYDLLP